MPACQLTDVIMVLSAPGGHGVAENDIADSFDKAALTLSVFRLVLPLPKLIKNKFQRKKTPQIEHYVVKCHPGFDRLECLWFSGRCSAYFQELASVIT